jgi:hypothetical protein
MPYLRPDPMRGRLKATTERRRALRVCEFLSVAVTMAI